MEDTINNNLGLAYYWSQGDAVTHTVAYILLLMSVSSWYLIFFKAWKSWKIRKSAEKIEYFWNQGTFEEALKVLKKNDSEKIYIPLASHTLEIINLKLDSNSLKSSVNRSDLITITLRQQINNVSSKLENGLTLLASVGSTAPFIGLFGTVWGIYHALVAVSNSGTIQIDKIAGPVGEALIMTGIGLAVAIPAVLGFNAFTRVNRVTLAELDAFAYNLHAYFTTGNRVKSLGIDNRI